MPSTNVEAKRWQTEMSERVGTAVRSRRLALGLSAQQLALRTVDLGYPITRVAISKIEANLRAGKVDVAEWLVLAQALEVPPALLLYPNYPDGPVEGLPGTESPSVNGVWWISGRRRKGTTAGTDLVELVEQRAELTWEANKLDSKLMMGIVDIASRGSETEEHRALKQRLRSIEHQMELLENDIRRAKAELWGDEGDSDE